MPVGREGFYSMISRRWDKKEWKPGKKFRFGMIKVEEFAGETEKNGVLGCRHFVKALPFDILRQKWSKA